MEISVRRASVEDIPQLVELYRDGLAEQVALREAWAIAEGLAEPLGPSMEELVHDDDSLFYLGEIDEVPFGLIWGRIEALLPQADGEQIGRIRLVYVDPDARAVGLGEAMLQQVLDGLRERGVSRFDAIVSPGHRLAKNFFESAGFSARRITMYHRDEE